MSDPAADIITQAVRNFRRMIDDHQDKRRALDAGLMIPETNVARTRAFVAVMDAETARLMSALPDFSPDDWEALIDLMPNVRKLLNIGG